MAHDLFLKTSTRNWSRDLVGAAPPAAPAATSTAEASTLKKLAIGGMALTVVIGTISIMSPWWLPARPRPSAPTIPPEDLERYRKVLSSPSGRIIALPR